MESLSDTTWDVVICGTGLQQSLLALALSRSDKKILHIDPNEYYGGAEAAFSLAEAESWASSFSSSPPSSIFASAAITRPPEQPALPQRSYALSLSPQLIHANSTLLSQLVSSRAYRQLDFLAVGSFFIYRPSSQDPPSTTSTTLTRIPSTREDVFSSTTLPARSKRQLMKFLKLVLTHTDEASSSQWQDFADRPLDEFLAEKMGLDKELRTYITTLTLSLDGRIITRHGLATIHKHLTSMGVFGPGFAAVYPKWGGGSEIAQVACRAGAVGGGIYMLGTGIREVKDVGEGEEGVVVLELTDGTVVKSRMLVRGAEKVSDGQVVKVSRMAAVVASPLSLLFETTVEGAPTPAVAVVALPAGSVKTDDGVESRYPIYVIAHSSDTGECPVGQSVLYLSTIHTPESATLLANTLPLLLSTLGAGGNPPQCLYQVYYEQESSTSSTTRTLASDGRILDFPTPSVSLIFDDTTLAPVREAWEKVMGPAATEQDIEYMVFADREGQDDDEDYE